MKVTSDLPCFIDPSLSHTHTHSLWHTLSDTLSLTHSLSLSFFVSSIIKSRAETRRPWKSKVEIKVDFFLNSKEKWIKNMLLSYILIPITKIVVMYWMVKLFDALSNVRRFLSQVWSQNVRRITKYLNKYLNEILNITCKLIEIRKVKFYLTSIEVVIKQDRYGPVSRLL